MFKENLVIQNTKTIDEINKITIWGVGLIGGSLGLALKKYGFQGKRIGLGRNVDRLNKAIELDAVDYITTDLEDAIDNSEFIVLCTPVNLIPNFVKSIIESVNRNHNKHLIITDVGSTKSEITKLVEAQLQTLSSSDIFYVGAHPMAGSHETGVAVAHSNLFVNAKCIITPTENTNEEALKLVIDLWKHVKAEPVLCSPTVHDQLVGAASHLPHLIASVLAKVVADVSTSDRKALDFTATGFRDTTRIAAGSPDLWTGIFTQNSDVLLILIDTFVQNLTEFKKHLLINDSAEIERVLLEAQEIIFTQKKNRDIDDRR